MKKISENIETKEKAIIVGVNFNESKFDFDKELEELTSLCHTANLEVVASTTQNIKEINPATLLGSGKVEEIATLVSALSADVVVVDTELSGSQMSNISSACSVKVIDRSMLILDIFASRAKSSEGRIQVKLAQLKYSLPRLSSVSGSIGRFGGGVGMRGPGETKLELDKRTIKNDILRLERELIKVKNQRMLQKSERTKNMVKQVALVGYTNAGKSTLMNTITKAGIYADDLLFATLDTTSRMLYLGPDKKIMLTDTVGFIDRLPHAFIQAFNATLEETCGADLLIHVVDLSDKNYLDKIAVVQDVLHEIGADKIPQIVVYNKFDKMGRLFEVPENAILVSAKNNVNIDMLKDRICEILFPE